MITIVIVAVLVLGVLCWLILESTGPVYERRKPLTRLGNRAAWLSHMTDGSTLTVRHDATGRSFSFAKAPDDGQIAQSILFVFREDEWSSQTFDAVSELLRGAAFVSSFKIDGLQPRRWLICTLTGQPHGIAFLANQLAAQMIVALGIGPKEKFTFRSDGRSNHAIFRRVARDTLKIMAQDDQPWLVRVIGRKQLQRHDAERRELLRDDDGEHRE